MREKGKIMIFFRDFPKKWEIYLKLKKNEKEKKKRLKRFAKIKKKYYWKKKDTPFYLKKVKDVPEKKSHMVVLFVLLEVAKDLKFMPIANAVFLQAYEDKAPSVVCRFFFLQPRVWCLWGHFARIYWEGDSKPPPPHSWLDLACEKSSGFVMQKYLKNAFKKPKVIDGNLTYF